VEHNTIVTNAGEVFDGPSS